MHVHSFGAFDFDSSVGKAISSGVVSGDACGLLLFSPDFLEDVAHVGCFLIIVEESSYFCFGGYCHDVFHDSAFDVDGSVWFGCVCWFVGVA